jgi:nucleoside 2-deoxyribosyltransferase
VAAKKRKSKPLVYLVGPISGCNPDQRRHWRVLTRERWSDEFAFIDPTEDMVTDVGAASYEIVSRDEKAVDRADAVLANMWKESIGTTIGIVFARLQGKTVVVVDPNRLNSRILAYYSDAVVPSLKDGMRTVRALLKMQESHKTVTKLSGEEEPFDRHKLAESIRDACRAAGRNDILAPAEIVPRVLRALRENRRIAPAGNLADPSRAKSGEPRPLLLPSTSQKTRSRET